MHGNWNETLSQQARGWEEVEGNLIKVRLNMTMRSDSFPEAKSN